MLFRSRGRASRVQGYKAVRGWASRVQGGQGLGLKGTRVQGGQGSGLKGTRRSGVGPQGYKVVRGRASKVQGGQGSGLNGTRVQGGQGSGLKGTRRSGVGPQRYEAVRGQGSALLSASSPWLVTRDVSPSANPSMLRVDCKYSTGTYNRMQLPVVCNMIFVLVVHASFPARIQHSAGGIPRVPLSYKEEKTILP